MGKINRGILGGFSGKVANIIGGSWKGIAYMRSQPLSVAQPNTAAQVNQRASFENLVDLAKASLLLIIHPLWNRLAVKMSGYNFFIQQNKLAVDDTGFADPAQFSVSPGNDTGVDGITIAASDGNDAVTVNWVDNSGTGTALATDIAYTMAWNVDTEALGYWDAAAVRSDAAQSVLMDANNNTGDTLWCWTAFKSADGLKISAQASHSIVVP